MQSELNSSRNYTPGKCDLFFQYEQRGNTVPQKSRIWIARTFIVPFFVCSFLWVIPHSVHARFEGSHIKQDHAKISKGHIDAGEIFIQKYLKHNGSYNKEKISKFIEHLQDEKDSIQQDIYQTVLLERLELELKGFKKSKKKAKDKSKPGKNKTLRGYKEYLIPRLELLLDLVSKGIRKDEWDGIVDDFIRGYIPYFVPNAHRTPWPRDINPVFASVKMLKPYKFHKNSDQVEANNLMVREKNLEAIQNCLPTPVRINQYLTEEEILILKKCAYDISLLDPGVSSLWESMETQDIPDVHHPDPRNFPSAESKIFLRKVNLRGHTSPKLKVRYEKGGKSYNLKLKIGQEVHPDLASSRLFELAGLNQDKMKYQSNVKVYLGDTSYDSFRSQFINKYGLENLIRFFTAHGGSPGAEWVTLKDVLFETRENGELRVSPYDFSSWDLSNRREYRSLILLYAWVGLQNTKPANFKFLFRETANGLHPLLRMQDTGSSLGAPQNIRKSKNILALFNYQRVNIFPTSFLRTKDHQEKLLLDWNDYAGFKRSFKPTTWYDLKWMARQIAKIKAEDIFQVLKDSGMALPIADIYRIKLIMRRNEMVQAFQLEEEFPLIPVEDLDDYNPDHYEGAKKAIKNGKVVQKVFADKNDMAQVQEKWATFIPKLISFNLPIEKWKDEETGYAFSTALNGLNGIKAKLGVSNSDAKTAVTSIPLGIGVQALLSRRVYPNIAMMNTSGKMRIYQIHDKIRIRFDLTSPMLQKAMKKIKVLGADASLRFYEYEVSYFHFDDYVKKAYKKPFRLPQIMENMYKFAAFELKTLEILKSYHRIGLEGDVGVGVYHLKPVVNNEISFAAGEKKRLSHYLLRDEFGQLHSYTDKVRDKHRAINFALGDIDLSVLNLPLFKTKHGVAKFRSQVRDYVFEFPTQNRDQGESYLDKSRRKKEYRALLQLKEKGYPTDYSFVKPNYTVKAKGMKSVRGLGAFFAFNKEKTVSQSIAKVSNQKGEKRSFFRHGVERLKSHGVGLNGIPDGDMLMAKRHKIRILSEIDRDDPENFLLILRTEDYYRVRDKENLERLISDVNRRFSRNSEEPLYRDYKLPSSKDMDKYRKVYALTRVFIYGKALATALKKTTLPQLKTLVTEHFSGVHDEGQNKFKKPSIVKKIVIKNQTEKLMKILRKLKKIYACDARFMHDQEKMAQYFDKLINQSHIEVYGIHLLKQLVGEKGLYVMGDIAGVLRSYSGLQDLQQLARRRFAAKSWGHYQVKPPLQRFLRYQRLVPPSINILKNISDDHIFGILETALPPNIEFLYGHGTKF